MRIRTTERQYGKVRGWLPAAVVALSCIVAAALGAAPALGAVFGGGWALERGNPLVITYNDTACADPSYQPIIEDAAALWNQTNSPASFVRTDSADRQSVRLFICTGFDDGPDSDYWGITHLYDANNVECLDCNYASASVFLNRAQLDAEPNEIRLKTTTHELGHVLGLAHPAKNDRTPQVMRQGWNGYFEPQAQDVVSLNAAYPGWAGDHAKPANVTTFQPLPAPVIAPPRAVAAPAQSDTEPTLGH